MAEFVVEFGKKGAAPNGGLDAPAFHRNHEAIWSAIGPFLSAQTGDVLELGSGTGQHVTTFAARTPQLTWWPSDIYPSHLASIEAWRRHTGLTNVRAPQRIDLTDPAWTWTADGQAGRHARRHALHQRAAHFAVGGGAKPHRRRRALSCATAAGCSSMARSSATASTRRRATPPSIRSCGRKIPHGACATSPISMRSRKTPA